MHLRKQLNFDYLLAMNMMNAKTLLNKYFLPTKFNYKSMNKIPIGHINISTIAFQNGSSNNVNDRLVRKKLFDFDGKQGESNALLT